MSNTYKNIKDYAFGEHKEAFIHLMKVFDAFSLQYFLIGAQARDLHFFQQGIKPIRGTRDIDFAVMVVSMEQYNELFEKLKENGFETTVEPYRLIWNKGQTVIDLLPFGQIEQDHSVNFDAREIEISVLAYRELNEELEEYYLDEEKSISIPVPPLHGLFMLKLLSWDDKKPGREKDLRDLSQILENYWNFVENEAYEQHMDLFDDEFRMDKAAARILGRNLKRTISKSEFLEQRILKILEDQSPRIDPPGLLLQKFAIERDKSLEEVKSLLDEILKGIKE